MEGNEIQLICEEGMEEEMVSSMIAAAGSYERPFF